jgi:hypothetical protein
MNIAPPPDISTSYCGLGVVFMEHLGPGAGP